MRLSFQSHVWVSRERKKGHARGFCYPHPSLRSPHISRVHCHRSFSRCLPRRSRLVIVPLSWPFDWSTGYCPRILIGRLVIVSLSSSFDWASFSCELCLYFLYLRHISAYLSVCTQWWSIFALTLSVLIPLFRTYDVIPRVFSPCKSASYLCVLWIIINRARVYRPQPCLATLPFPYRFQSYLL